MITFFLWSTDGTPIGHIPSECFLYFEGEREVGDVANAQAILSTRLHPEVAEMFQVLKNQNLDAVLSVYRKPPRIRGLPDLPPTLYNQYLLRYSRTEHLVNGKPRKVGILRDKLHLLKRPLIYPPGDLPLVVHDSASLATAVASYMTGVPAPPVVSSAKYTGLPAPADTCQQMWDIVSYCKARTPQPLQAINMPPLTVGGGIADHRVSWRYENSPLLALQRLRSASWYAWYHGFCPNPVDFDLVPAANYPNFPWDFVVYPGGMGRDLRVGNTAGNDPIILSAERDNVSYPSAITDRLEEVSATVVGGQGSQELRDVLKVVDLDRYNDSPWNGVEVFTHSSKIEAFNVSGGVEQAAQDGWQALRDKGIRREVSAKLRSTEGVQLGRDIQIGDLVTVSFDEQLDHRQIRKTTIRLYGDKSHELEVELGSLDGKDSDGSNQYGRVVALINGIDEESGYVREDY